MYIERDTGHQGSWTKTTKRQDAPLRYLGAKLGSAWHSLAQQPRPAHALSSPGRRNSPPQLSLLFHDIDQFSISEAEVRIVIRNIICDTYYAALCLPYNIWNMCVKDRLHNSAIEKITLLSI